MNFNIPHTFLGLTHKHPDELDTLEFERDIMYWDYKLGKMVYLKEGYKLKETNEFNDGFFDFASVETSPSHWEKVFENNHLD